MSKQSWKSVVKTELWSALLDKSILPPEPGTPSKDQKFMEMLRLMVLDLEMQRLDLKEKGLKNELEIQKMEETRWQIRMKELDLSQTSFDIF